MPSRSAARATQEPGRDPELDGLETGMAGPSPLVSVMAVVNAPASPAPVTRPHPELRFSNPPPSSRFNAMSDPNESAGDVNDPGPPPQLVGSRRGGVCGPVARLFRGRTCSCRRCGRFHHRHPASMKRPALPERARGVIRATRSMSLDRRRGGCEDDPADRRLVSGRPAGRSSDLKIAADTVLKKASTRRR